MASLSLWQWIDGHIIMLQEAVYAPLADFNTWWKESFKKELAAGFLLIFETLEPEMAANAKHKIEQILANPRLPDKERQRLQRLLTPQHPGDFFWYLPVMIIDMLGLIGAWDSGPRELAKQFSFANAECGLLSPDDLILASWRGVAGALGVSEQFQKQGLNQAAMSAMFAIRRFVPQPNDLIRFVVRDVFREDVVTKYGYDTDYEKVSESLKPWLSNIGMDASTMKLYWRAHWELPSLNMAYEMLHRRLITQDDIRQMLKINDVAPYFIEPLVKSSYNPYTRVDVRRMYASGVLTEAQVFDAYQDLGYDLDHARKLTDWTTKSIQGAEIKLSKSMIESAYRKGQIQRERALRELDELGYSSEDATLVMGILDADMDQKWVDEQLKTLHSEALKGLITLDAYKQALAKFEIPEKRITWLMDKLAIDLRKNRKIPEKSDIKTFYLSNLITERQVVDMLLMAGYDAHTAGLYLSAWTSGPSGSE